jgi:hypothetical protein
VGGLGLGLVRLVVYLCRSTWTGLKALGSGRWPRAEATVTSDPTLIEGFGGAKVEITYSYRFEDELYTGLHEEPCFLSESEYMERFMKGRNFIVRVKPREPEVSLVRDADQADGIRKTLGTI